MQDLLRIVSPADESTYFEGRFASDGEVSTALSAARRAWTDWRPTPVEQRVRYIDAFVDAFTARADDLAHMVAWQIGRPLTKADESSSFRHAGDLYKSSLHRFVDDQPLPSDAHERRFLRREPYGVNLSICAWNYPVAMTAGLVLAPLLLGNVVVFKHAPQTARISEVLNDAAIAAQLPAGVFQALNMTHHQADRALGSGSIDLVNFIGSVRGGLEVRRATSTTLVHQILELGGKDPTYVCADADLRVAVPELIWASFGNSGQSCCSVERIYVEAPIYDRFVEAFVAACRDLTVGHPIKENTAIGPVVSAAAARRINGDIADAIRGGAQNPMPTAEMLRHGPAYVAPTVLLNVTHDMRIMREETFGPVAPIMKVKSDAEALRFMNDSDYGLTASIWTADLDRGIGLGRSVDAGNFYVNRSDYVDDYLPWGGVKRSGLGRTDGWTWGDSLTRTAGFYARRLGDST